MREVAGRARPKRRLAFLFLAALALLLALAIGPFTYFRAIWPPLSPILPRPEAVPQDAVASYHWKANGTHWHWQYDLPSGCAKWSTGADDGAYIRLLLSKGSNGCRDAKPRYSFFYAGLTYVSFDRAGGGGSNCSRYTAELESSEIEELTVFISQTEEIANTRGEKLVVAYAERFITQPEPLPGEHPCGDAYQKRLESSGAA